MHKTIQVTISKGAAIPAKIGSDMAINAGLERTSPVIVGGDTAVPCTPDEWTMSGGYYVLSVPPSAHMRGFNARVTGAESAEADAVVSYKRLPSGNILIYSSIPFDGRIFIR